MKNTRYQNWSLGHRTMRRGIVHRALTSLKRPGGSLAVASMGAESGTEDSVTMLSSSRSEAGRW